MLILIVVIGIIPKIFAENGTYQTIVQANNKFTRDIYKQIAPSETGNVIMSPLSAITVLALLHSGCNGSTAQELSKGLYLPNDKKRIQTQTKSLLTDLQSSDVLDFNIANAAFLQQNFQILQKYRKVVTDDFKAKIQNLNFAENVQAAKTINDWVAEQTKNIIKDLISANDISGATRLILVNALHFKGNWSIQFSEDQTTKDDFYKTANDVVKVDTLHLRRKRFNYFECKSLKAQFLELPFKGGDASMVFVVPTEIDGLAALEKRLCFFSSSIKFESTYLNIAIPKFKFDYTINFKDVLEKLGVTKIFDPSQADLSGIAGNPGDLVVDQVRQKAFIDLNEGGVEAAAATFVGIGLTSVPVDTPKEFKADRPFIFYIKYKGIIAFAGKVTSPKY